MSHAHKKMEQLPVSFAKTKLLELVREAQKGHSFEITKGGTVVARLLPPVPVGNLPATGFANVTISGNIISPLPIPWEYDATNLPQKTKTKKNKKG